MKKKIPVDVYRVVISLSELESLIYDLKTAQSKVPLGNYTTLFLYKMEIKLASIRANLVTPTYQQTGRPEGAVSNISLAALGGIGDSSLDRRENNPVPDNLKFERRTEVIKEEIVNCTADEQFDAECAAADHKILTGENKHWKFFLPIKPKGDNDVDINML